MARPTPEQMRIRERFEALIALFAPALDVVLAAGDRLSRIAGPEDDYYPIRPSGESFELAPTTQPPAPDEAETQRS